MSEKIWHGLWWLTLKILKLPVYALVAAIYLSLATVILIYARHYLHQYTGPNETWMLFHTPLIRGKILVPEEIAKSKDCERFFKWEYENIPLIMHGTCPWYDYTPIYEVKIGELELKIPRKYLLLPASTERQTYSVSTKSFIYPSMKIEGRKTSLDSFWFTIKNNSEDDRYKNIFQKYFWSFLHTLYPTKNNYKFIPIDFNNAIGKHKYKFVRFAKDNYGTDYTVESFVYTEDHIEDPQDFIVCGTDMEDANCDSVFMYRNVYIHYRF